MPFKYNPISGHMDLVPTADEIQESATRVFVTPAERALIGTDGGGTGIGWVAEVATFADLPTADATNSGKTYLVQTASGVWPFRKKSGLYQSNGSAWNWLGTNALSSLADVDTATVTDGQILRYDSAGGGWRNADAPSSGSSNLPIDFSLGYVAITGAVALNSAAYGRAHLVSGTAADYTITLPAPSVGKAIHFKVSTAGTKLFTLDAGTGNTIEGVQSRKLVAKEAVTLIASDANTWVKADGVSVALYCQAWTTATQLWNNSVNQKITLAGVSSTNAPSSMFDDANDRIPILRPGNYKITVKLAINNTGSGTNNHTMNINKNGSSAASAKDVAYSATYKTMQFTAILNGLAAGDYIEMSDLYDGSNYSTSVLYASSSYLLVEELNPW